MFSLLRQLAFIVLFGVFCAMVLLGFTCVVSLRRCARFAECVRRISLVLFHVLRLLCSVVSLILCNVSRLFGLS